MEKIFREDNSEDCFLKGNFVDLIPLEIADAQLTLKWRNQDRARFLNRVYSDEKGQVDWIKSRPLSERNFMLVLKSGEKVGMLSLINIDLDNRRAESARFLIGEEEKCAGEPIATEAMFLLYRYAFDYLKLSRIYGHVQASNRMMIKWQKFFGMKEEGVWRSHYKTDDGFDDAILLGILNDEYIHTAKKRFESLIKMGGAHESK